MIRRILAVAAVLVAANGAAFAQADGGTKKYAGQTLRVATFGGTWQKWVEQTVGSRFKEETGADVQFVPGIPAQFMAQMASAKGQTPPFDVVDLTFDLGPQVKAQDLVIAKLDPALVPNLLKLPEFARSAGGMLGPTNVVSPQGILYDAAKLREAGIPEPKDWDDLANPKLAGHVAMPDITFVFRAVYAAVNFRKTGDPTNFNGSVEWVKSIKQPIIFNDFPTLQTRFAGGQIWAIVGGAGYLRRLSQNAPELKFVFPPAKGGHNGSSFTSVSVVKGTPRPELAQIWINTFISTPVQTAMAKELGYATANLEAMAAVKDDPAIGPLIFRDEQGLGETYKIDYGPINKAFPDWVESWNRSVRR